MQIRLSIEERPPVLRSFLEELQDALGTDARVWASMVAGNETALQRVDAFVHVFEASNRDAAIRRLQPAIREADPEMKVVIDGTTSAEAVSTADRPQTVKPGVQANESVKTTSTHDVQSDESENQQRFQFL